MQQEQSKRAWQEAAWGSQLEAPVAEAPRRVVVAARGVRGGRLLVVDEVCERREEAHAPLARHGERKRAAVHHAQRPQRRLRRRRAQPRRLRAEVQPRALGAVHRGWQLQLFHQLGRPQRRRAGVRGQQRRIAPPQRVADALCCGRRQQRARQARVSGPLCGVAV
jgi:hypothetical protein